MASLHKSSHCFTRKHCHTTHSNTLHNVQDVIPACSQKHSNDAIRCLSQAASALPQRHAISNPIVYKTATR